MHFKLIVALVEDSETNEVIEAAREAGATGSTVISQARGEGVKKTKTFFGLTLDAATDMAFFLLEAHLVEKVIKAISEAGRFSEPGTGIALVLPVEKAVGLESQIKHFEQESRKLTGE